MKLINGFETVKLVEQHLNVQITIVGDVSYNYKKIYCGDNNDMKIYLFYINNHYHVINSMPAFFKAWRYCTKCEKVYHCNLDPCNEICKFCKIPSCKKEGFFKCDWCKLGCKNNNCLSIHQINFCSKQKKCTDCGRFYKKNHICNGRVVTIAKLLLMLLINVIFSHMKTTY